MANTIRTISSFFYLDDGSVIRQIPSKTSEVATTSDIANDTVQTVGTSHEAVAIGDATDTCFARIENLHATAIVQIGTDVAAAFVSLITLNPGDPPAILPRVTSLAATYLKSDVASTPVRVTLCKIAA